ncbi:MAG: DUF3303 family protein [Gemmatimonadaceae bacterium]|nr:DUF3303 family protein [Gemmatimonadaceae bacterium]
MQYMIVESFKLGPEPVYARVRERGRLAPEGLRYMSSVISGNGDRCYQLMECDRRELLDLWMAAWTDLVDFEVVPVITSTEAATRYAPAANAAGGEPMRHDPTPGLEHWITHTELASADPDATKAWCSAVMGWKFMPSFPMPGGGEYHLFRYSDNGGGGIRPTDPSESPGSIPFAHVAELRVSFDRALREGAAEMLPPTFVMEGVTIAIVRAPGGVTMGLSGP